MPSIPFACSNMERPYLIIDVFTQQRFAGKPAAVVLDAEGMSDAEMQAVAAEFNLSETTFVLPPTDERALRTRSDELLAEMRGGPPRTPTRHFVRFRWFTPTVEMHMAGHPTIAGIRAMLEVGRIAHDDPYKSTLVFIESCGGVLTGFVERMPEEQRDLMIWLDLIDPTLTPSRFTAEQIAEFANVPISDLDLEYPICETQDRDVIAMVRDATTLNRIHPDLRRLDEACRPARLRGLCLATHRTLAPSITIQSRFFAPAAGVNEVPVTGSLHGPLAAYAVRQGFVPVHDGLAGMNCVQGIPGGRFGLVHALLQPRGAGRSSVRIGGRTVVTMRGTLFT